MTRKAPEQALQRQIVGYLTWALAPPAMFTSFPAGGGGLMRGMILKGTGLKAGMPDLMIIFDKYVYFLELKAGTGLSEAQKAMHETLRRAGAMVEVCHSLDEVRALVAPNGRWWPLGVCIRETKPSLERIRRGMADTLAAK